MYVDGTVATGETGRLTSTDRLVIDQTVLVGMNPLDDLYNQLHYKFMFY